MDVTLLGVKYNTFSTIVLLRDGYLLGDLESFLEDCKPIKG